MWAGAGVRLVVKPHGLHHQTHSHIGPTCGELLGCWIGHPGSAATREQESCSSSSALSSYRPDACALTCQFVGKCRHDQHPKPMLDRQIAPPTHPDRRVTYIHLQNARSPTNARLQNRWSAVCSTILLQDLTGKGAKRA